MIAEMRVDWQDLPFHPPSHCQGPTGSSSPPVEGKCRKLDKCCQWHEFSGISRSIRPVFLLAGTSGLDLKVRFNAP